ncbi:MAG TPA: 2-oxoglutarate dehydrogenase complex dihydrolipoyllysine-residue succinyltransferase, partial [Ferruginibacter sp.]|nr:2-oxoglutarate dehydrogenase complex dihydrolipoyllysine-residue succinyltransferase [Ferruginibacter sp.]HRO17733.1 2-oxoglutarate dehydrogenase complex dihydrolipoyllysine-residue succinyltransferase [Ferruginibacter sp.]HRQ20563.1 2-oxoglutarate dehydrogenase complex dihydrolipoyllysine-residue succinyltransferase [Ferruginibacter sp.]
PTVGESINEVTLVKWLIPDGGYAVRDAVIAELESEKATFEVNAEQAGAVKYIAAEGDTLAIGDVICSIDTEAPAPEPTAEAPKETTPAAAPVKEKPAATTAEPVTAVKATPVAAAIIADKKVDTRNIQASGSHGKITKQDVLQALSQPGRTAGTLFSREEKQEKMSNLRKTISRRLVEAKNSTAMLTTFNEVDMGPIMELRKKYKDKFKEVHGVGLGFMSFFTKACCYALQKYPSVNAYIDGENIFLHDYCDISIAVSGPKGLVVPVIRNAESLGMAEIESAVVDLATKARNNKLTVEEMSGGTFTITNGGIFGSMMSTPIINIPQSAILGMHNIVERPMAVNGQVVIKPMMYVALSYDHRIIDGRESVGFLVTVKQMLEKPELLLMGKDPMDVLLEV